MKNLILAGIFLGFVACSSMAVTPYKAAPPHSGPVTLYHTAPQGHEILAYVEVQGDKLNQLVKKAKQVAAEQGGNGLLVGKEDITHLSPSGRIVLKGYAIRMP